MYLVFSALTSSPTSLLAYTNIRNVKYSFPVLIVTFFSLGTSQYGFCTLVLVSLYLWMFSIQLHIISLLQVKYNSF
jgi:hypothetical protein